MPRRAVVVKVGSGTLVDPQGRARPRAFARIARDLAGLADEGVPVALVSSGAIALGLGSLGRRSRRERLADLQAGSAVGQTLLLKRWELALGRHGRRTAQVLLTAGDVHRRQSYVNARRTLETLLRWGMVPVVNENDSTATDEITFGDNDALAAQVALILNARTARAADRCRRAVRPRPAAAGRGLIPEVRDHRLLADLEVGGPGGAWGSGGMRSKVVAAEMASAGGIGTVIANGSRDGTVLDAAAGRPVGTRFRPDRRPCPPTSCGCATASRCAAG